MKENSSNKKKNEKDSPARSVDQVYSSLVERLKKLETEYKQIADQIRKRKELRDLHPDELDKFIGEMQRRLDEIDRNIRQTRTQLEKRVHDLDALKSLYAETEKLMNDVERRLVLLESRASGNQTPESVNTLKKDVSALMAELNEIRNRREALSRAIEDLEQKKS